MEKKKKKNNKSLLVVIIVLCILAVIGLIISKDKTPNKNEVKKVLSNQTKIEDGTVFYQNDKKDAYIKFKDDNVYEWVHYNDKKKLEKETGYYKIVKGVVTLNHKYQAVIMGDFVEVRNPLEDTTDAYHYTNYVDRNKMKALYAKMNDKIYEYKKNIQTATGGKKIESIETNVEECYRYQRDFNKTYDNELICKTEIKVYFKDYNKKDCEKTDGKYSMYAADTSEPICEKDYLDASGYVKYDLDGDYNVIVIYPTL